ncbi:MAG: PleD family two-component system response regulator [Pyrinomonadaceae bacterium]
MPPTAKRVLCVDGNNDTCEILTTLLGVEGYETRTAGGVGAALKLASAEQFDLIIVTTPLPDGEGLELCRMLRASAPGASVLIYSLHPYEPTRAEALAAGAQEYLFNNGDTEIFMAAVRRLTPDRVLSSLPY